MGDGDLRRKIGDVVVPALCVGRIRVACKVERLDIAAGGDVGPGRRVGRHDPSLRPHLYCHVRAGHPASHVHLPHGPAGELERHVGRAVGADVAGEGEDQVFCPHPPAERPVHLNAEALGNPEVERPELQHKPHIGGTDAGRKRACGTVSAGVRVGADDDLAGSRPPFLHHNLVADTLEEVVVVDPLLLCELPHEYMVLGSRYRVGGDLVVEEHDDPLRIIDVFAAHLAEDPDRQRAGDVVDHSRVHRRHHHIPRADSPAAFHREYLFCDRRRHGISWYGYALQTYLVWQDLPRPGRESRPFPPDFPGDYPYVTPCGLYREKR